MYSNPSIPFTHRNIFLLYFTIPTTLVRERDYFKWKCSKNLRPDLFNIPILSWVPSNQTVGTNLFGDLRFYVILFDTNVYILQTVSMSLNFQLMRMKLTQVWLNIRRETVRDLWKVLWKDGSNSIIWNSDGKVVTWSPCEVFL